MALSSAEVRVAVTGAVSRGVTGSTPPTDAATALAVAFKDLGYISDSGVVENRERSTKDVFAWQAGSLVRTIVESGSMSWTFTLIETNTRVIEAYYGGTVTTTSIVVTPTSTGGRAAWVIDVVDGAQLCRTWIPAGEVTSVGELTLVSSDAIGYEVTVAGYSDTSLTGGTCKKFYSALVA